MKEQVFVVVLLSVVLFTTAEIYYPYAPCRSFAEASGTHVVAVGQRETCWHFYPSVTVGGEPFLPAGQEPEEFLVTLNSYIIEDGAYLLAYDSVSLNENKLIQAISGSSNENGSSITITFPSGKAFFTISGSGEEYKGVEIYYHQTTINFSWDTPLGTRTNPSLNLFYALIFVFVLPLICTGTTALPCYKDAERTKKERCTLILFTVSAGLALLFFGLILGRKIVL